jgi:hypothetical protein
LKGKDNNMQRRPTTQDITWLIDLHRNNQLDLNPPYQRKSVWTRKDKQFFLDTIFRNYPSPAIFLHKTIDETGQATYHVVDGKQRTETILNFVNNKLAMANDYGDSRLNGKKWGDLQGEPELKKQFWNYQITIEMIDVETTSVNTVFDRLNRNSRKLTDQELRHAKFEGWFIKEAEAEVNQEDWRNFGVVTTSRARRMVDIQFVSELLLVILENRMLGFDQDLLDELYGKYDEPLEISPDFDEDDYRVRVGKVRGYIAKMEEHNNCISQHAKGLANFYTIWSVIALEDNLPEPNILANSFKSFMEVVEELNEQGIANVMLRDDVQRNQQHLTYLSHLTGATSNLPARQERYKALKIELLG